MAGEDDYRLPGFEEAPAHFRSATQIARVQTEQWAKSVLFCPNCGQSRLERFGNNSPVADLYCGNCNEQYELKSTRSPFGAKIVDGAYRTMLQRLRSRKNPHLMLMRYDAAASAPTDVLVVPKHFFVPEIIEERKPLALTARRAGWIGCNILLSEVPGAGKIPIVRDRRLLAVGDVTDSWRSTLFLREASLTSRGWLLEVMKAVEEIGRDEFGLSDVYAAEDQLQTKFPGNRNVRPKIRQQLQVLRDSGFLQFLGGGRYRLMHPRH